MKLNVTKGSTPCAFCRVNVGQSTSQAVPRSCPGVHCSCVGDATGSRVHTAGAGSGVCDAAGPCVHTGAAGSCVEHHHGVEGAARVGAGRSHAAVENIHTAIEHAAGVHAAGTGLGVHYLASVDPIVRPGIFCGRRGVGFFAVRRIFERTGVKAFDAQLVPL